MGLFLIGNCTMFTKAWGELQGQGWSNVTFANTQPQTPVVVPNISKTDQYRNSIKTDPNQKGTDEGEYVQVSQPLNELSWAKADLQSKFNNCANQIDESLFTGSCDVQSISWALPEAYHCFFALAKDDTKEFKNLRNQCISFFEDGDDWLKSLQSQYDQEYSWLVYREQVFLEWWSSPYRKSSEEYKSYITNRITKLEKLNTQINTKKKLIQGCKTLYEERQNIKKEIDHILGDIVNQEKSFWQAYKKNQKKKAQNSNQEYNNLWTSSESIKKAEDKRKAKDEKADYALNQACLSARDFLYTLKYGTTMKKGNPWNDLIKNRSPREMLDKVVYDANAIDQYQETAMDGVTSRDESCVNGWGRITNTLCWVKNHIHPYIQWIVYLGLTLSVILLIYNGFKMVTNVMHGEGDFWKIKTNILYIGLWIIILTGFYYLLDIVMAIINFLFD